MYKRKLLDSNRFTFGLGLLAWIVLALPVQANSRWYDQAAVDNGEELFQQYCTSCHAQDARGTANWKEANSEGQYPPPPLDGTAHAWHHSIDVLRRTILDGGAKIGGIMPGFKDRLSHTEIDSVIAYFQSRWPDEVYAKWSERYEVATNSTADNNQTSSVQKSPEPPGDMTRMLKLRLGGKVDVSAPVATPVSNIYQTQFNTNYAYITADGRYLFMADLIDLEREINLTNNAKRNIDSPVPAKRADQVSESEKPRAITELLKLRLGSKAITNPIKTPVPGIFQARFGLNFAYLTEDGRYVFMGNMIDLERGVNFTSMARRVVTREYLKKFSSEDKAIFPATTSEKASVNVFTDTSCSTCRKLFLEVPKLQAAGITVQYLPFPDEGLNSPGYNTLKQVWCAEDRAKALSIGKGVAKGSLPAGDCPDSSLVDKSYELGKNLGVIGTPAIFKQNGAQIKGYIPSEKLIPMILEN